MRSYNIIIAGLCAAALLSCNKENPTEDTSRRPMTFSVVSETSGDDSKAYLDGLHVNFKVGDAISVYDGTANNMFTAQTDGSETTFSGEAAGGQESYLIVSPYRESNFGTGPSTAQYEIPDVQVATPGTFDPAAFVSVGKAIKGGNKVTLRSAVSLVKVTVPSDLTVKEIQLACGGQNPVSQAIAGTFTYNANNNSNTGLIEGRYVISLVPKSGSTIAQGDYYIVVRTKADYPGLTLAYVNGSDQLCKRTSVKTTNIERNHILPLGTLNTTNFTPVSAGTAVLKPSSTGNASAFVALLKKLAGGPAEKNAIDNTLKEIVFKANTLTPNVDGSVDVSSEGTIKAVKYGTTVCIYTEAPVITLNSESHDLFFNFRALESVKFNNVNAQGGAFTNMFQGCYNLKSVDFGDADFSKVINMNGMFYLRAGETDKTNHTLESINFGNTATTSATKMVDMFREAWGLKYLNLGSKFTLAPDNAASEFGRNNMFYFTARDFGASTQKCEIFYSNTVQNSFSLNSDGYDSTTGFNRNRFRITIVP